MGLLRDKETYHPLKFTVEEYLDDEKSAPERREYIGGEVFAMAGASEEHEKVALNVASAFLAHLRGSGCKVFKGDMKLRCKPSLAETFYYPDVFVTCSPKDTNPI
ncbi:MAG: Uma2 family endonuclease, partial [Verrucomicrobiota bacterium]